MPVTCTARCNADFGGPVQHSVKMLAKSTRIALRPVLIVVCLVLAQGLSQVLGADHLLFGVILAASAPALSRRHRSAHPGFELPAAWKMPATRSWCVRRRRGVGHGCG
jgi:hypothetical protein